MIERSQLVSFLNAALQSDKIRDYCPNGLDSKDTLKGLETT
jgi:hypothetical protein